MLSMVILAVPQSLRVLQTEAEFAEADLDPLKSHSSSAALLAV